MKKNKNVHPKHEWIGRKIRLTQQCVNAPKGTEGVIFADNADDTELFYIAYKIWSLPVRVGQFEFI